MANLKTRQPRHWRKALLVWAAAQALAGTAQAGGVYFQPVQLPPLPGLGDPQSISVRAINNAGHVTGVAMGQLAGSSRAFLYAGGQMLALVGEPVAGESWVPSAISDPIGLHGKVYIAGNMDVSSSENRSSFVQQADTLLNRLSPAQIISISGAQSIFVSNINQSGRFVGRYRDGIHYSQAFAGSLDGSFVTLQNDSQRYGLAFDINNAGLAVGSVELTVSTQHAAIWNAQTGALQDIGTLGGRYATAKAINEQGTVVGNSNVIDGFNQTSHAFIYRSGVMTQMAGNLDFGDGSGATSINNRGQTLGWFVNNASGAGLQTFLHSASGGAVSLASLGVAPNTEARINDYGQIVAGGRLYNPVGVLTWAQSAGGNTADPNNWDSGLGFAPNQFLDVVIGTFRDQTITADSSLQAKSLRVTGSKAGRATLQLSGGALVNALEGVTIEARGRLQGAGRVLGPVVMNHGTVNALPGQLLTLDGGLDNHGLVTGNGRIEANLINRGGGAPGVMVGAGQHLTLAGTVHTAADASRINIQDGGTLAFEGRFVNQGGAVLAIHRGTLQLGYGAQRMDNGGQVLVGSGRAEILGDINNTPRGLVHAQDGADLTVWDSLRNDGEVRVSGGSLIVYAGAVSGKGSFTGTEGMHRFQGGYGPGNSPAEVIMGNVQFASLVTMELGGLLAGSQHDRINFTGSSAFEETSFLSITLTSNFVPHAGDVFALFSYAQAPMGNFEDFYLPGLSAGLSWDVSRIHTTGVLAVTSVPEPSAAALWLAGLAGMGAAARRRTRKV